MLGTRFFAFGSKIHNCKIDTEGKKEYTGIRSYLVPHLVQDPARGVYLAEPIADLLAVSFTAVLFAFRFKKALKRIEAPTDTEEEQAAT